GRARLRARFARTCPRGSTSCSIGRWPRTRPTAFRLAPKWQQPCAPARHSLPDEARGRSFSMSLKGKFAHVEVTDVGKVRDHNEDAIGAQPDIGLWVLADGMGGYNAGEVASGIAVKTVIELVTAACKQGRRNEIEPNTGYMRQTIALRDAIHRANKIINQTAHSQPQCEGMGTTLVASLFYDDRVSIAHVGDSRMYRLRDNKFEQIT